MLSPRLVTLARAVAASNARDCAALASTCDAFLGATDASARQAAAHEIAAALPRTLTTIEADRFRAAYRNEERPEALRAAVRALRTELARRAGKAVA